MTIGELIIDFDNRKVFHGNRDVRLTPKEYSLFEILAQHPGEVVTQEYLIRQLWGTHAAKENLRVHIKHIRQKIGDNILVPRYIFTESGIGYRLSNATFPPPNPSHTSVHRDHPQ